MDRAEQAREGVTRASGEEEPLVDMALAAASPLRRGMQQRVNLARATVDPQILLMTSPSPPWTPRPGR